MLGVADTSRRASLRLRLSPPRTRLSSVSLSALWRVGPPLFVVVVVVNWFKPGHFVGTGDVAPLVRRGLSAEVGAFWNHQMTGAGATTADTGRVVEIFVIRAASMIGMDDLAAQRILFAGVMALACVGTAHAASLLLRHPGAVASAGLLGAFNPFVLLQLPNLIFPLSIGVAGLLIGEVYGFTTGRRTSVLRLVLASLPLTYVSINPPLLAVIAAAVALPMLLASVFHRPTRRQFRTVARALPVILLVHGFWVVPALVVYSRGAEGLTFAAVTNAESWSWVYAQNSLGRVATLTAHWGWPTAEYFPWSAQLDLRPWSWLRWVLPLGALTGCLTADRGRRVAGLSLGVTAVALVVFSQGLHEPFSGLNAALYRSVPGWWLFRDPVSKFGPLLVLAYAILFGLLVDRLLDWIPSQESTASLLGGPIASVLLCAAAIAHPWPLLTGDVIPSDRGTLPPSHVAIPSEWDDLAGHVSQSEGDGKVAVLPLNDYYQLTTTWGYHGVDIVNQVFDRPVLQRLPGGYFGEVPAFDGLLVEMERAVRDGDSDRANRLFDSLGVSHLVVRHDVVDPNVPSDSLEAGAQQLAGLEVVDRTSVATLFARANASIVRSATATSSVPAGAEPAEVSRSNHVVLPATAGAQRFTWGPGNDESVDLVLAEESIAVRLSPASSLDVQFLVEDDRIVGYAIDDIALNGVVVSEAPIVEVHLDGAYPAALELDDRIVPFEEGMVESVTEGDVVGVLEQRIEPLRNPGELSDCNRVDDKPMSELGFSATRAADSITLTASAHSACVAYPLRLEGDGGVVSLRARTTEGAPGRACVWSRDEARCLAQQIAGSPDSDLLLELPAGTPAGDLELFVYADAELSASTVSLTSTNAASTNAAATTVTYEQAKLSYLHRVGATTIDGATIFPTQTALNGEVSLRIAAERTSLLEQFGSVGDCHRVDERSLEEVGIAALATGSSIELRASDHTACVDAPVVATPGSPVVISFDHSSPTGTIPRLCLWQVGLDTCAEAPAIETGISYRAVVETDPGATALRLFLYADGRAEGAVVWFDDIDVVRADAPTLILETLSPTTDQPPSVQTIKQSPSSFRVDIGKAEGTFFLVVPESFSDGWVISGLPEGWTSEHFLADGYANAWKITGTGSASLNIFHLPAQRMRLANLASVLTLALVLLGGALGRLRRPW